MTSYDRFQYSPIPGNIAIGNLFVLWWCSVMTLRLLSRSFLSHNSVVAQRVGHLQVPYISPYMGGTPMEDLQL